MTSIIKIDFLCLLHFFFFKNWLYLFTYSIYPAGNCVIISFRCELENENVSSLEDVKMERESRTIFVYLAADLTFCRSLSAWTLTDDPISIGYPLSLASWYRSTLSYCVLFRWHGTQSRRTSCDEWSFKEVGKNLEIKFLYNYP